LNKESELEQASKVSIDRSSQSLSKCSGPLKTRDITKNME